MEDGRIPNKLRAYRRCHGLSQKKVACILGLKDTSTLSRWERGYVVPGVMQMFRLSRIYQTLPHQLYDSLWNSTGSEAGLLTLNESIISETEKDI